MDYRSTSHVDGCILTNDKIGRLDSDALNYSLSDAVQCNLDDDDHYVCHSEVLCLDSCCSVLALDMAARYPLAMDDSESNSTWLLAWNNANDATVSASRRMIRPFRKWTEWIYLTGVLTDRESPWNIRLQRDARPSAW